MEFKVPGMSCGHCTKAIENSIKAADPAASIDCDLGERRVKVGSALSPAQIGAAISAAGYEAQPIAA